MDSYERHEKEVEEETVIEEVNPQKDTTRKTFATLKDENDKLRTYLGLVKMCNYSAIAKIKSALNDSVNMLNAAEVDANYLSKQLDIIQNEILNMQQMHTKLEEGIESYQVIETSNALCGDDSGDTNRETVVFVTTRYEVPRKSTGISIKKTHSAKNKSKMKANKDPSVNAKLLSRVVDNRQQKFLQIPQHTIITEQQEAVASIDHISGDDRENVNELVRLKVQTKRPYISEEFKSSHLQRLVEAKRRREEMNKQLEREGKRKPRLRKSDEQTKDVSEASKKSPKRKQLKKKIGSNVSNKKKQTQQINTTQSIVVPINQASDLLTGQTIQIIANGGTQTLALCRSDGTFIPSSNSWQTTNNQWTTESNNFTPTQWSQYQT